MNFTINFWCTGALLNNTDVVVGRHKSAQARVTLFSSTLGKLAVKIECEDFADEVIETNTVGPFTSERPVMVTIVYSEESGARILLNGILQEFSRLEKFVKPEEPEIFTTSSRKWLFLGILNDLRDRVEKGDQFSLVKSSETLRQILFDPYDDLLAIVAEEVGYRDPFIFEFCELSDWKSDLPKPETLFLGDEINPKRVLAYGAKIVKGDKASLLKATILEHQGAQISVEEILRFVAYNLGGTHFGAVDVATKRDVKRQAHILELFQDNIIDGKSQLIRTMRSISEVTITAVSELERHILHSSD